MLGQSPRVSAGASLLSCSLLVEICPQISQREDCADVNCTRRIGPKTSLPFREIDEDCGRSVSCNTQPICRTSFTFATAFLSPSFFGFLFFFPQPLYAETSTHCRMYNPIQTFRIDIREDANSHRSNLVLIPFKKSLRGCRLVFPGGLLPLRLLFLDELLPLGGGSEGGAVFGADFARS